MKSGSGIYEGKRVRRCHEGPRAEAGGLHGVLHSVLCAAQCAAGPRPAQFPLQAGVCVFVCLCDSLTDYRGTAAGGAEDSPAAILMPFFSLFSHFFPPPFCPLPLVFLLPPPFVTSPLDVSV